MNEQGWGEIEGTYGGHRKPEWPKSWLAVGIIIVIVIAYYLWRHW